MKTLFKILLIGGIGLFILMMAIGLFVSKQDEKNKNATYDIQQNELFSEDLDTKKDYEDGEYTVRYEHLAENLNSVYAIRTREYEFQFRKGLKELHVIPVLENGKTNSENRIIYKTEFGGVIQRHLAFGLSNSKSGKGMLDIQFDSETNPKKVVVVKYITDDITYCKRGVVYDVLNKKGNAY